MNTADCANVFRRVLEREPYDYQPRAWESIFAACEGKAPLLIEAPTAAGKTEAAVIPYLTQHDLGEYPLARRLIYVLPSRSLVEAQANRIREYGEKLSLSLSVRVDHGAAGPLPMFFGDVVVTTWDSFLYGLAGQRTLPRRFTIPAGNIATALVVFDEVQMYQDSYFYAQRLMGRVAGVLTGAGVPLVFMTATLSQAHREDVLSLEGYDQVIPQVTDTRRPTRGTVKVNVVRGRSVYDLLDDSEVKNRLEGGKSQGKKSLVVVNTVGRAVEVYEKLLKDGWGQEDILLLHSRFLAGSRREREKKVMDRNFSILAATQVVEAGLDIPNVTTGLIEAAPPDALIQRIGRVARRPGENGMVWIAEPRNVGEDTISLSPYAFVSETRIDQLKAELALEENAKRRHYRAAGQFALTINDAMREVMTTPGAENDLETALLDLESSRKLVDPFYQKLWNSWREVSSGQSEESTEVTEA